MKTITPYANDSESMTVGGAEGLTIENGTDRIACYGSLDITKDRAGLEHARLLKVILDRIVQALEADRVLPDKIASPEKPTQVKNPFA